MTEIPPKCPAKPCGAELEAGHLLCRDHWKAVPPPLQREVNATWRTMFKQPSVVTVGNYRDARDRAIAAACRAMP